MSVCVPFYRFQSAITCVVHDRKSHKEFIHHFLWFDMNVFKSWDKYTVHPFIRKVLINDLQTVNLLFFF